MLMQIGFKSNNYFMGYLSLKLVKPVPLREFVLFKNVNLLSFVKTVQNHISFK